LNCLFMLVMIKRFRNTYDNEQGDGWLGVGRKRKLDIGFETFPGAYVDLHEIKDLLIPLHRPREWQGPLNKAGDNGASLIRFIGPKLGFDEAISLIRKHVIPKLFAVNS
jgi:hypothetical protein